MLFEGDKSSSYGHRARRSPFNGGFTIDWTFNIKHGRTSYPQARSQFTERAGVIRFIRKWDTALEIINIRPDRHIRSNFSCGYQYCSIDIVPEGKEFKMRVYINDKLKKSVIGKFDHVLTTGVAWAGILHSIFGQKG